MPLKVSDGIGAWIKDFQKSDAPQFKGKDKEERRDMAVAAYLSAKRGPLKDESARQEAMSAKQKADMDRAMAAFKKRGGKVKKLPPGRAAGAHGKDDPGAGMRGMLDRGDTKGIGTRKKVRSMGALRNQKEDTTPEWQRLYGDVILENAKLKKVKQLGMLGLVSKSDVNKLMMAMKAMDAGKEVPKNQRKIIFDAFGSLIDLVTGDTTVFQKAKKAVKEEVDEGMKYTHAAVNKKGLVIGFASDEKDAKDMARRKDGKVVKLKKPMSDKKGDMMVNRPFKEEVEKDPNEYDNEGEMMKDHLDIAMDAADEMYDMVEDNENLPEWVQSKITKAADYLDTSRDYLMSQKRDKPSDATNEARVIDAKKMDAYRKFAKAKKVDDDSIRMAVDNPNHAETKRMMRNRNFATALKMYKAARET